MYTNASPKCYFFTFFDNINNLCVTVAGRRQLCIFFVNSSENLCNEPENHFFLKKYVLGGGEGATVAKSLFITTRPKLSKISYSSNIRRIFLNCSTPSKKYYL